MSWNGSGTFNRLFSWVADKTAGLDISSTRMDADTNDIASNGFGNCLTRDGQGSATANLPMNSFRHTGVGNGVASTDYAAYGQLTNYQKDVSGVLVTGGTSTAYTVTTNEGLPSTPANGQLIVVTFHTGNGASATLKADGGTAFPLQFVPGDPIGSGVIFANSTIPVKFNSSSSAWILMSAGIAGFALSAAADSITNAMLSNANAWTLKGNPTGSSAAPTDFTIHSLTAKATPVAADEVPIWDVAGTAMKKATLASLVSGLPPLRGYLSGLTLSGGGSQTLTITAGVATSDDASTFMSLGSTYTKTFASWVVGSGNGGLDAGSIANNTWYHVFLIERTDTGVVDVLISTSATAPTLPTNYTQQRRIGSIKTNATPNIISFFQNGDTFLWSTLPALDVNTTLNSSAASATVQTPPGVRTEGIFHASIQETGPANQGWLLSSLDIADTAPAVSASPLCTVMTGNASFANFLTAQARVWTNTTPQIRHRGTTTIGTTVQLQTIGWVDSRGRA